MSSAPLSSYPERITLSYPKQGYTRLWIYLSFVVLPWLFMRFMPESWFQNEPPGPDGSIPYAWRIAVPIMILIISAILAIMEAGFLFDQKFDKFWFEFDENTFYITYKGVERPVPLQDIYRIRLHYTPPHSSGARRFLYQYDFRFGDPKDPDEVSISVYAKTQDAYLEFVRLIQEKNPSVEIINWATNNRYIYLDWFKKKKR